MLRMPGLRTRHAFNLTVLQLQSRVSGSPLLRQAWRGFGAGIVIQFAKADCWLVEKGLLSEISASKTDLQLTGRDSNDPRSKEVRAASADSLPYVLC